MADSKQVERFDPFARRRSIQQAASDLYDDDFTPNEHASEADDSNAVVLGVDGSMQLGAITMLPNGLLFNQSISRDDWVKLGHVLRKMQSSLQFLIGDWLVEGEKRYGVDYKRIAEEFGYKESTLYTLKWVCSQVKIYPRGEISTIAHCKLVANMSQDDQRYWLHLVDERRLSVRKLEALINGLELAPGKAAVDRLVDGALRHRAYAEKLAQKPKERAHLLDFALEQETYWRQFRESLEGE